METENDHEQSQFVAQKILELREEGVPLNRIAVLFRSSSHANDLEIELKSRGIPYTKFGGFKFTETAHIKDVVSVLRLIANPQDGVSWQRILLLLEGVGPKAATTIYENVLREPNWTPAQRASVYQDKKFFLDLLNLFQIAAMPATTKPATLIEKVVAFYTPLLKVNYDDHPKRVADLESLNTIASRYENLGDFLADLQLEPPESSQVGANPESSDEEKLVLSTIHSAKGLEWHSVFILSLVDGYLPSFRSLGDLNQLEEERRLLYVAMTRAEENLFLIKPHLEAPAGESYYRYSGLQLSKVCRFLDEVGILGQYTERWQLVEERPQHNAVKPSADIWDSEPKANPDTDARRKYLF